MKYYKIADINIAVDGADYEYFDNIMCDYQIEYQPNLNIHSTINFKLSDKICLNGIEPFSNKDGRYYFKTDDKYGFYDYIEEIDKYVSFMETDYNFENIVYEFCDLTDLFGIEKGVTVTNVLGNLFQQICLHHDTIVVHASSISYQGQAVTFTAPSGTGKSTHTSLWSKYYNAVIINDDMPAIRCESDKIYAYGTPWSGKTHINKNIKVPLKAMVFIERKNENSVIEISSVEALIRMIKEIQLSSFKSQSDLKIKILDKLFKSVPIYLLECNISKDAVDIIKNEIFN